MNLPHDTEERPVGWHSLVYMYMHHSRHITSDSDDKKSACHLVRGRCGRPNPLGSYHGGEIESERVRMGAG